MFNGNEQKSSIPLYLIFAGFTLFYRRPVIFCILYLLFLPRLTGNFGEEVLAGEIFLCELFLFMKIK